MSSITKYTPRVKDIIKNIQVAISSSKEIEDDSSREVVKSCILELRIRALEVLIFVQEQEYSIKKRDREILFEAYDRCRMCILVKSDIHHFKKSYTIPNRNKKDFFLGTRLIK